MIEHVSGTRRLVMTVAVAVAVAVVVVVVVVWCLFLFLFLFFFLCSHEAAGVEVGMSWPCLMFQCYQS